MTNETRDSVLPLITAGDLIVGQVLTCPLSGKTATVIADGLQVAGTITTDPTVAMQHVTGVVTPHDNGWIFWKLNDPFRGFIKPLEHVRVAWQSRQLPSTVRTSDTHPLRINTLTIPGGAGKVGLTFCPGKKGDAIYGGAWNRDLEKDLAVIRAWGADAVVTLLEEHEFALLGVPEFPEVMCKQSFQWFCLHIRDSDIPDERFEIAWPRVLKELENILKAGGGVVIHCRGGLGRTGLVAARLLVEEGMPPDEAIALVRRVRPGSIETWEQESYIREL